MDFDEFKMCVKERVEKQFGKEGTVNINRVLKNNGMVLEGIVIMESGSNVAPTIYLNSYYDRYLKGMSLDDIVSDVFDIYEKNKTGMKFDPELFNNYDNIKASMVYKIINYDKNKELLEEVPHKRILDLAVVYYCIVDKYDGVNATILIHNSHLNIWNITEEQLHKDAVNNTPKLLTSCIKPMTDMLIDMADDMGCKCGITREDVMNVGHGMYILTNNTRVNGAACILYENVLEDFAKEIQSDLYILPSSIHEVIILPKDKATDKKFLVDMVRDVNSDGVLQEEVLSDNVYEYNRKTKMITL